MRMSTILLAVLPLLHPQAAPAQNFAPMNMAAITQGAVMGQVLRNTYSGQPGPAARSQPDRGPAGVGIARPGPASGLVAPAAGHGGSVALTYESSAELRRQTVDGYVRRLSQSNPEAARVARDQFARNDYGQVWRGLTKGTGLSENDAADSMAALMMLGWMIANNSLDNPNPSYLRGVRAQLAPGLAAEPRLSAPATRAVLGEELKLLFVTLHAGWQGAQREGRLREYSDGVAAMFRQQGTDLRALRLTDGGFAPR